MAFMEGSTGYDVRGIRFPAVRVTPRSLDELLARPSRDRHQRSPDGQFGPAS